MTQERVKKYRSRFDELRDEAIGRGWTSHWKDVVDYLLPRKGRYLNTGINGYETNRGDKKHDRIKNGSPSKAVNTLAAGLQGGLTSPARKWFSLILDDDALMDYKPVRVWLDDVRDKILDVMGRSNFYVATQSLYKELPSFGTSAMIVEADPETVARCRPLTIGEFYISLNSQYRPDCLVRPFNMSARQLVEKFGEDKVSHQVKRSFDDNKSEKTFPVIHMIQPVGAFKYGSKNSIYEYESVYFEYQEDTVGEAGFLRESGYFSKPFIAPRWEVTGTDTYGDCPAFDALADIKMLQAQEKLKLQVFGKYVSPPMKAPESMKSKGGSVIAGGVSYGDDLEQFTPLYQVNPNFEMIEFMNDKVIRRISDFFFNDLFLSLLGSDREMTAREVAQRNEDKLILLNPALVQMESEMLSPLIDRYYSILEDAELLPPIPEELQGQQLKVEYTSLLAQAQKLMGLSDLEQMTNYIGGVAELFPEARDKFNIDEAVDEYSKMLGVAPRVIRSSEEVQRIREERQAAQQAAAQREQQSQDVADMEKMGKTPVEDNMLSVIEGGL